MPDRFDDDDYLDDLIREAFRDEEFAASMRQLDSEGLSQRVRLRIEFEPESPWQRALELGMLLCRGTRMGEGKRAKVRVVLDKRLHVSASVENGYPRFTIEDGSLTIELVTEAEDQGRAVDREDLRAAHIIADNFGGFTRHIVRELGGGSI